MRRVCSISAAAVLLLAATWTWALASGDPSRNILSNVLDPTLRAVKDAVASPSKASDPAVPGGTDAVVSQPDGAAFLVGGETFATATVISSLPYTDTGNTTGHVHDYTPTCGGGSSAPDLVYRYTAGANVDVLDISLCGSSYDTILQIYDGDPAHPVGCNDDGCAGLQSRLPVLLVTPGHTYYIVVDGYGSSTGAYTLNVTAVDCGRTCPAGGLIEGEVACAREHDYYNGGCNVTPPVFQTIEAQAGGCATMCGESDVLDGYFRDTDWFEVVSSGGIVRASCTAEFPLQFIFIYGTDCANLQYDLVTADACQTAELAHYVAAGSRAWIWVGPSVFEGVPCHSRYVLEVCGIAGGSSAVEVVEAPASNALGMVRSTPNPASERVSIGFDLPVAGPVSVRFFAPTGRLVQTLVDGYVAAGSHEFIWDRKMTDGALAPAGVYLYEVRAAGTAVSKPLILLH